VNRTDRLLAIVLELQARGAARAQDLAEHFETSKRTIYRDIEALCEAGVPVVATPGRGYALMEGYFLPPLSFGVDEAMTLLLGADFVAQRFYPQYQAAARAARRKLEAVLPERHRPELDDLRETLHVNIGPIQQSPTHEVQTLIGQLRHALRERRTVRFRYHARYSTGGPAPTEDRHADPYSLAHTNGAWYLLAYCHRRGDTRMFRLDRIEDLALTTATFIRPAGFPLRDGERERERVIVVRVLFTETAARWVREAPSFFITNQEETSDGLLVTLRIRREDDVLSWLLGYGRQARVLEPETLQQRLRDEAEATARQYQEAAALLT
jgi:predicted DNA-binding transcriptional regulator YafY